MFQLGEWYFTMQFLAGCFAYSNSALNPLIYAGFNKNFKQGNLFSFYLDLRCRMNAFLNITENYYFIFVSA